MAKIFPGRHGFSERKKLRTYDEKINNNYAYSHRNIDTHWM